MSDQITIVRIDNDQRKHKYSPNTIVYFRFIETLLYLPFYATKEFQEDKQAFDDFVMSLCHHNAIRIYSRGM